MQSTAKMAAALKLSSEDGGAVFSLRKELEKAWKLVDAGQEKVLPAPNHILSSTVLSPVRESMQVHA